MAMHARVRGAIRARGCDDSRRSRCADPAAGCAAPMKPTDDSGAPPGPPAVRPPAEGSAGPPTERRRNRGSAGSRSATCASSTSWCRTIPTSRSSAATMASSCRTRGSGSAARSIRGSAFVIALDGAVDERLQVNTPEGKLRVGLRDAFADVLLGTRLVARGGFFQAWVDPEALVADTERELVDNPIESRGMRATEGFQTPGLTPGRSLGAAIRIDPGSPGEPARGGTAPSRSASSSRCRTAPTSSRRTTTTTSRRCRRPLLARLPHDSWIMAAARYNPRTVGDLPFRQDEDDLQATAGLAHRARSGRARRRRHRPAHDVSDDRRAGRRPRSAAHARSWCSCRSRCRSRSATGSASSIRRACITTDRVMEHTVGGGARRATLPHARAAPADPRGRAGRARAGQRSRPAGGRALAVRQRSRAGRGRRDE